MINVLIVEDEYITRMFLSNIINWQDYNMNLVAVAKDGKEALDIIENQDIHIVITDLKMPNINGNELIKILKSKYYSGKIIVLSNYDDFELVKDAMKNGAYEYLLKVTISKDEIIDVLKKAIKELDENNKSININDIIEISNEKLKVNEYIQEYLKGNKNINLDIEIKSKYLNKCTFIYLRALSTDIKNSDIEKRLSSFIHNVITNSTTNITSEIFSIVQIKRSEYSVVIKTNNNNLDIELLLSNITRNVLQYLNVKFEKVLYKKDISIDECLEIINNERKEDKYKINSKVITCRIEIKNIIEYINNNLEKRLTLDSLAKIVNMNESYLSRIFKEEVDITISEYIKIKRLEKATELLKIKDARVKDVAISVGIQDQLYFSRLFTKKFNMTPTEYKEKYNAM